MEDLIIDKKSLIQLDTNIKEMITKGATKEEVQMYTEDFKNQYASKKKENPEQVSSTASSDESWRNPPRPMSSITSGYEVSDYSSEDTPSEPLSKKVKNISKFDPFKGGLVRPTETAIVDNTKTPSFKDESKKPFVGTKPKFDPFKGGLVRPTETAIVDNTNTPSFEDDSKKPFKALKEDIGKQLDQITPELMSQNEEKAVPYLNYLFEGSGVTFEESGGGDAVKVTTPKGQKEFPLDIFFDAKKSKSAQELKDYIKTSTNYVKNPLIQKQNEIDKYNNKILNEKNYNGVIANINIESNNLEKSKYDYIQTSKNYNDLTRMYNSYPEDQRNTPGVKSLYDEITKIHNDLKGQKDVLDKSTILYNAHKKDLDYNVGKYFSMLEDQGTTADWMLQSLAKGVGSLASGAVNIIADVALNVNPFLTDEQIKLAKKQLNSVTDPLLRDGWSNLLKSEDTSTEAYTASNKRSYVGQAAAGFIGSVPAMLGGAPIRAMSMFSQIYDEMTKEINDDPKLSKIPESEKLLLKSVNSTIGAALEEFGFRNAIESKGLLNNLALKVLGQYESGMESVAFKELVDNVVRGEIKKGGLKMVGGFLAEAETGVTQELADIGLKQVYNDLKGKELFTTPENVVDLMGQIGKAGFLEGLGGGLISSVSMVGHAYKSGIFQDLSDNTLKVFGLTTNNEKMQKAYVADLKLKVNLGTITLDEAKEQLSNYQKAGQLFNQLAPGLSLDQVKESLDLLKQKQDITEKIKDKDLSSVKPYQEQINAIDEKLTNITNNAIQEQSTSESVLRSKESQLGLQEMGKGDTKSQESTQGTEKVLTDEEQKRKVVLEQALQSPDTTNGTVTIGDIAVPIAEAQKELDALVQPVPLVKPLTEIKDESKAKNQTKNQTDEAKVLKGKPQTAAEVETAAANEVAAAETVRNTEIDNIEKPKLEVNLATNKELVGSDEPLINKKRNKAFKTKFENLKKLIDCL